MDIKGQWSRLRRTPIGLDVGSRLIKAVQLEPAPGGAPGAMRVVAAAVVPRASVAPGAAPAPAAVGASGTGALGNPVVKASPAPAVPSEQELAALPEILDRAGFSGRRVVLAAPTSGLMTSVLELPARAGAAPARQIARMELARAHRCAPDAFEMGYWDLPAAGGAPGTAPTPGRGHGRGVSVIAVGLPHAHANALLDTFEAAGMYVTAIDVGPCALARACAPLIRGDHVGAAPAEPGKGTAPAGNGAAAPAAPPMMAILDLGWDTAMLWLLYRGAIIYGRPLADGGTGHLHAALVGRQGLEADVADYLLTEVGLGTGPAEVGGDAGTEDGGAPAARGRGDRPSLPDDDARSLFTNYAEELVRELGVSFAYASNEYADGDVGRLLLVGGGAGMPALAEHLSAALGVPASRVAPVDLADCDPSMLAACGSPALTAATGLAMFAEAA